PRIELEKEEGAKASQEKSAKTAPVKKDTPKTETSEAKAEITIDEFAKVDLRVAQVLTAEKVEGADKLLRLTVKLGEEERQIVVVANLKPTKLRGILSQGMLLAASQGDRLAVLSPERIVGAGAQVR